MSAQLFDNLLLFPDNTNSHQQIVALITAGKYTGSGLPEVAHKYLDVFCNSSCSDGRRRWAGIALVGMMRASLTVVQRLHKPTWGLSRIGNIILDREESEERKILAGLIIRQGLEAGTDFADFWTSDKVLHSAPNFPREADELWMAHFQTYLDTLSSLKLTDSMTNTMIFHPISLVTADGHRWTGRSAVAAMQRDLLTIIVSDFTLEKFHFFDIPVSHVKATHLREESPHESQEGRSGHSMYTLAIVLQPESSSYRLDSSDRMASEFGLTFHEQEEAAELKAEIQDARKNAATSMAITDDATATSSSLLNPRRSSAGHVDGAFTSKEEGALRSLNIRLNQASDDTVLSGHLNKDSNSNLQPRGEKGNGKLPRVSRATIHKAAQTQQPQSGLSRVTKARAAKNATSNIVSGGDDEAEDSPQDEYDLTSTASMRGSIKSGSNKTAQSRRNADADDEDFVPTGSKTKSRSTKRKRDSNDAPEHTQPTKKKTQARPGKVARPPADNVVATKQPVATGERDHINTPRAREPMTQSAAQANTANGMSSRPSLIGGLLKSKSPSGATASMFKRPGQPASTPGRARTQLAQTTPKTQTPVGAYKDMDELPTFFQTSTPRSQSIHEEDFGLGYTPTDTEILSSNTKRVPDSPHAESTAISGHADQDEVRKEKHKGDLETAKSDPFQQPKGHKAPTTFLRKLTGESSVESGTKHKEPFSMPTEASNDDHKTFGLLPDFPDQPLPKHSPSLLKYRAHAHDQARAKTTAVPTEGFGNLSGNLRESCQTDNVTSQNDAPTLMLEATRVALSSRSKLARTEAGTTPPGRSSPAPVAAIRGHCHSDVCESQNRARTNDSIISAPPEAIEDTLPEVLDPNEGADDVDGEATLVCEAADLLLQHGEKASELKFRSSPPIPDSSSVRHAYSDTSDLEAEPSPPTSRADEIEWEASLQPHQRDLHDQLLRTSKRVVRHIVDNETAVTDISDMFANDGERLLHLLLERQCEESTEAFQQLSSKKQDLLNDLEDASNKLKLRRTQFKVNK